MCYGCGDVEIHGRGARYCAECLRVQREAAAARKRARARARHAKPCRGCGGPKPHGRRVIYCERCSRERSDQVRLCERCPNPVRGPHARLCVDCKAQAREAQRAYKREWAADRPRPSGRKSEQTLRMSARLKADKAGRTLTLAEPIRGRNRDQRVDSREFPTLPTGPLIAALDRHLHRLAVSAFDQGEPCRITGEDGRVRPITAARRDGGAGSVAEVLCERLGISDKTLREWRAGARPSVQFDLADRILTRLGWLWWDVWQEGGPGHEVAARAFEGEEPEPLPIAKPRGRPFGQRAA